MKYLFIKKNIYFFYSKLILTCEIYVYIWEDRMCCIKILKVLKRIFSELDDDLTLKAAQNRSVQYKAVVQTELFNYFVMCYIAVHCIQRKSVFNRERRNWSGERLIVRSYSGREFIQIEALLCKNSLNRLFRNGIVNYWLL